MNIKYNKIRPRKVCLNIRFVLWFVYYQFLIMLRDLTDNNLVHSSFKHNNVKNVKPFWGVQWIPLNLTEA